VQAPSFFAPSLLQQPADLLSVLPLEHSPLFFSSDFTACPLSSADLLDVAEEPPIAEFLVDCVVDFVDAVEASLCAFAAKAKKAKALRIKIFFMA
jgi:Cys-tRNA synthase (O-phospho-L-seryl-tRNA:Cys-tRNA synthase)